MSAAAQIPLCPPTHDHVLVGMAIGFGLAAAFMPAHWKWYWRWQAVMEDRRRRRPRPYDWEREGAA